MEIAYRETKEFTAAQLERLFLSVGWESGRYPERLVRAMRNSSHVISAWDGERLIGLIRSIDDGETVALVHYLLVDPAYQGHSIGRTLLRRLTALYPDILHLKVMPSDPATVPFYESCGFKQYENYRALEIRGY